MDKRTRNRRTALVLALTLVSLLGRETLRAKGERSSANQNQTPELHSLRVVDFFNLFANVGAFPVWGEPNDLGAPEGLLTRCTGTLIDERVLLTAGHCVAWIKEVSLPRSFKFFVTFSPNARDRSGWRQVAGHAVHPSLPPCPPPDLCTFRGLDPGILDIGLVFLSEPVRRIAPATLARPNTLAGDRAEDALMILPGYGDLDSAPGGGPQPVSEWDGWRRIKISKLRRVVDNEWASWSLPGVVCFGDSGSPTFLFDPSRNRLGSETVAVASDGGDVCSRGTIALASTRTRRASGCDKPSHTCAQSAEGAQSVAAARGVGQGVAPIAGFLYALRSPSREPFHTRGKKA